MILHEKYTSSPRRPIVNREGLVQLACDQSTTASSRLDCLAQEVDKLKQIVGAILTKLPLTDQEVLEICELQHSWEIVE